MKTIVFAHSADFDGICSMEIARRALGDSVTYLGYDYGQLVPDLTPYDIVYLIDVSFPIDAMKQYASKIRLIDHHVSLVKALDAENIVLQDRYTMVGPSACRLAWQYFFGSRTSDLDAYLNCRVEEPYAVQLLGLFDVWQRDNPDVDRFQLGLQSVKDIDWEMLLRSVKLTKCYDGMTGGPDAAFYVDGVIERGKIIQDYTSVVNAQISQTRGFDVRFEGLLFRALNIARSNSLTFSAAIRPEHDGCLSYFWDGAKWKVSLYSVPGKDHDMSLIAKKFGGGGHYGAAGMVLQNLPKELGGQP
jgi:uncharacterized protein